MNTFPLLLRARHLLPLLLALALTLPLGAQVPQLLNYQGRVAVGTTGFTGTGQFKFALVSTTGSTSYWSNNGTSTAGSQPTAAVSLPVANGLYALLLGDTTLTNMTAIPATVFTNSDVRLRVWFNDGTNGFQLLTPDQRIGAVGYAVMAGNVPDGAITSAKLAGGAVTAFNIAGGTITAMQLASGAAALNLAGSGLGGVPSGGIVLSGNPTDPNLGSAGYVRLGRTELSDAWDQRASSPLSARENHTAVWTGNEMFIWGGDNGSGGLDPDGARYNPASNSWTLLPSTGAPVARQLATAVWTGSEMIIWGGLGTGVTNAGGRYNLMTGWQPMSTAGAPSLRFSHTAIWTGTEMIIWGGVYSGTVYNDGARYTPSNDTWVTIPNSLPNNPTPRYAHSAVWTGTEMIVFGGRNNAPLTLNDGARLNAAGTAWTTLPTSGAPGARANHMAVWTGTEMIIWGGYNYTASVSVGDGCRWSVGAGWTALPATNAPTARSSATAVWTGSAMIVWGGYPYANDGASYSPTGNAWTTLKASGAGARTAHTAVWTGSEMILYGGYGNGTAYNDTFSYTPARSMYLYQRP